VSQKPTFEGRARSALPWHAAGSRAALLLALLASACAPPPVSAAAPSSEGTASAAEGSAPAESVSHAPRAPVPLEEYVKIGRVNGASFSYDERFVAYGKADGNNPDDRPDVWVAPIAGGEAHQVTHVAGRLHSFAFSPTADKLAFEADQNGDELPHLFLTNAAGAAPRDLAAAYPAGRRTQFVRWTEDGSQLLYLSNLRDEKYLDLYAYDVARDRSELLWKSSGNLGLTLVSGDGQRFITTETLSDANANLYAVERAHPDKSSLLTPHAGDVQYYPWDISRDERTLYYTSDEGGEYQQLYALDFAKQKTWRVNDSHWDVEKAGFSRAGKYFWTMTNEDGAFVTNVALASTHAPVALPPPPAGGWEPIESSRSDRYIAARLQSDARPSTVYVLDLQDRRATRLVEPLPPSLAARSMFAAKSVRIPSFDGRAVPAFLYRPNGAGPFPAVIDVHGGPTSQSRREFNRMRQYLVSKGYVVLVPNVRGSTGYGKSYTRLDNLDLGGGPLQDVVACKHWLSENAGVDAARVVIMGGSYGGYMTLAAATFAPTEFAAHVDFFGVSDLKSLVESFPPYWQAEATYIYQKFGDPKNPAHAQYQHDRSPLNFVDKIARPLLVVQGDHDARVKKDQSDRMVEALRQRNVPVHYLVIPNEGHGFSRNQNFLLGYAATDRFLDRYLFGDTSVEVLPHDG
jgi:dipeptidyl aminopeptidase/acylaminoacyl peptidase